MGEKTLIVGKISNKIHLFVLLTGLGLFLLTLLLYALNFDHCRVSYGSYNIYYSLLGYFLFIGPTLISVLLYASIILMLIGIIFYIAYINVSITATDRRVFGTAAWGKRVDLPLDLISAVATSFMGGIAVSSSSGSIKFRCIENNEEVHEAISKLLIERQQNKQVAITPTVETSSASDVPTELKQYKELLDEGIITEEEFNAKKKQLLNI